MHVIHIVITSNQLGICDCDLVVYADSFNSLMFIYTCKAFICNLGLLILFYTCSFLSFIQSCLSLFLLISVDVSKNPKFVACLSAVDANFEAE